MWANWVLDVTHGHEPMAFCPIEDDGTIVTGMTMISGKCPGRFVGVVHFDGNGAVNEWLAKHSNVADELAAANGAPMNPNDTTDSRSVIARIEQLKAERDAEVTAYTEENVADDLRAAWRELNPHDADELDALLARPQPVTPATVTDEDVERACDASWPTARFSVESMTDWAHADPGRRDHHKRVIRAALEAFTNKETTDE